MGYIFIIGNMSNLLFIFILCIWLFECISVHHVHEVPAGTEKKKKKMSDPLWLELQCELKLVSAEPSFQPVSFVLNIASVRFWDVKVYLTLVYNIIDPEANPTKY